MALPIFPRVIGEETLLWKVYNIETGKVLKAGFESEDDAKDWLEERSENLADEYVVEEMDTDELEEWQEEKEDEEDDIPVPAFAEDVAEEGYFDDDDDDDESEESDEESLDELYEEDDDDDL